MGPQSDDVTALRKANIAKRGLIGHVDASHSRIEFGSVSTEHGEIMVAFDRDSDTLHIHGVAHPMANIANRTTAAAIYATAATFSATEDQEEQARQRIVLGALVDAAMARDQKLSDRVRASIDRSQNA